MTVAPIAIVGNINLDVRTAPIRASEDILHDGETSVSEIYESIGGGGANAALAAARLGGKVHFVGCVGRDELGKRLRHHLERHGVVTYLIEKDAPTGRSVALTWDNHHRHFVSCLPSSAMLEENDIDIDALLGHGCRLLYRADIWFAPHMLDGGNESLLRHARHAGMETSLDLNWDPCWNQGDDELIVRRVNSVRAVLKYISVVHGNERDLCRFAGTDDLNSAVRTILTKGAEAVIVHQGNRGSAAFTATGESAAAPARLVEKVKHETGTGDVFAAAFMLHSHLPLAERLAVANDLAVQHLEGSTALMPRL